MSSFAALKGDDLLAIEAFIDGFESAQEAMDRLEEDDNE